MANVFASSLLVLSSRAFLRQGVSSFGLRSTIRNGNFQFNSQGSNSERLPTIQNLLRERFRVGDYYVWLYEGKDGTPTSWEKYRVTKSDDDHGVVVIEMATKFSEEEEYFTHHRMTVDFWKHLDAESDSSNWKLSSFEYYVDDQREESWKQIGVGDNVQAFEEKFDVFSMLNRTNNYDTRVVVCENKDLTLIRSSRHNYTAAWYAPYQHSLSGVALLKNFAEHSFSLIKIGRQGSDEIDVDILI